MTFDAASFQLGAYIGNVGEMQATLGNATMCLAWTPASTEHTVETSTVIEGSGSFVPAVVHVQTYSMSASSGGLSGQERLRLSVGYDGPLDRLVCRACAIVEGGSRTVRLVESIDARSMV